MVTFAGGARWWQKQRVAIARAMAMTLQLFWRMSRPGAHSTTGRMVMDLFHKFNEEEGKTIVLITHSPELAEETERIITIRMETSLGREEGHSKMMMVYENIRLAL